MTILARYGIINMYIQSGPDYISIISTFDILICQPPSPYLFSANSDLVLSIRLEAVQSVNFQPFLGSLIFVTGHVMNKW